MSFAIRLLCCVGVAVAQFHTGFSPLNIPRNGSRGMLEWQVLEGRTADPCHKWADISEGQLDCKSVPDSQVTVLLPSETSKHTSQATINGGTFVLTMYGRGFGNFGTTGLSVRTARQYDGCATTDAASTAAVTRTAGDDFKMTFSVPTSWTRTGMELEDEPRMLCFSTDATNYRYIGFKVGAVWHCDPTVVATQCPPPPTAGSVVTGFEHLTFEQWRQRKARQTCCTSALGDLKVGQCILSPTDNPLAPTSCCGGASIENSQERCCNPAKETTSFLTTACPCWRQSNQVDCPTGERCCLPTKYTELSNVEDAVGECYNPDQSLCCNTGMRYDAGSQQCCVINGVQSNNVPCPCNADNHCWGGQYNTTLEVNLQCCMQSNTTIAMEQQHCSIYSNFPNGTAPYHSQRCLGSCFDPTFQICCNGVQCVKSFEKCCNNTCCNRFTQTCETALRPGTPGNRHNYNSFMVTFETCSTIEQMQPIKAMWIFVLPCLMLLMTLLSTGLVLVFANKASSRSYASIERAMLNVALLAIVFSLPFFFSPAYKYAIVIIFAQLVTILTAAARIRQLNAWCLVLQIVLVLYLLDPFTGSQIFTLASSRTTEGMADRDSAGLIHLVGKMYNSKSLENDNNFCSSFYLGYFALDPMLRDADRFDDPNKTVFGYCDRRFVLVLLVFAGLVYICALLQLVLTFLALLLRFTKPQVKLVVREEWEEQPY